MHNQRQSLLIAIRQILHQNRVRRDRHDLIPPLHNIPIRSQEHILALQQKRLPMPICRGSRPKELQVDRRRRRRPWRWRINRNQWPLRPHRSGRLRNIFSAASAPIAIPQPIASVRPKGPLVPVDTPPPGPPPPPPIDLKFFGTATSADGHRQAFLLKGEDVFLASDGDIVQRRYKIVTISPNSVLVEDLANSNQQTLPLIVH